MLPKIQSPSFVVTLTLPNGKRRQIDHYPACIRQEIYMPSSFYLAAVVSWLWLKLPWHLVAMTAVTKATAALTSQFASNLPPRNTCQVLLATDTARGGCENGEF